MSRYAFDEMVKQWEAEADELAAANDWQPRQPHGITIEPGLGKWLVYVSDVTAPRGRTIYAMVNTQEEAEAEQERANVRFNYRCSECMGDVRKCDCMPF